MIPFGSPLPPVTARAPSANHPAWTRRVFSVGVVMAWDQELWRDGRLYADAFLERMQREYGGVDLVVLWNTYPRIGVDDRSQWDHWRDLPGLEDFCARVRARGPRLALPYKDWDLHTRDHGGDHGRDLAALVRRTGADAIFMDGAAFPVPALRTPVEAVKPDLVWFPEVCSADELSDTYAMSCFQFKTDGASDQDAPGVPRLSWIDRRHRQIETRRYAPEQTREIQRAWLAGNAMLVWENVFGYWNPLDARSRSLRRAMLPVQRRFADLLADGAWTPWITGPMPDVYGSLFEHAGIRLWALVNRSEDMRAGDVLEIQVRPGEILVDVVNGRMITPHVEGGTARIPMSLRARGIGAVVAAPRSALGADLEAFLASQAEIDGAADWRSPTRTRAHPTTTLPHILVTTPETVRATTLPASMVRIGPWTGDQVVFYRMRECGFLDGEPDHLHPYDAGLDQPCLLRRSVRIGPAAIDRDLVTNRQFAAFLAATGWKPTESANFLRHWRDGRPVAGDEDQPVSWIDIGDARAFARWAGKRLPTDAEWQRAAQGPDWQKPVFPADSPGGIRGMSGRLWQWTDSEFSDGHTRYCLVRGGSSLAFPKEAVGWYFDNGPQHCERASKLILHGPALDRAGTIGFRCVVDLGS